MCKVLRGQAFETPDGRMSQQQVDARLGVGYTSIQGNKGAGAGTPDKLNYDELVVYDQVQLYSYHRQSDMHFYFVRPAFAHHCQLCARVSAFWVVRAE